VLIHTVFEITASAAGVALYGVLRARHGDPVDDRARLTVLVGAAVGAALGARFLWLLGDPGGKTIVGGLLGGLIGVELAKKLRGIRTSTGDLFVMPLILAICIGRIGCFLAGPEDRTYGLPSDLPWAIAMSDGVRRHPVALYEIAFLLALAPLLRLARVQGDRFRIFMTSYLVFRFFVDFLKPYPRPILAGLTAIQWACLAGVAYYASVFARRVRFAEAT
jgi:prolipoprotein diacylglyceryltransferase